jgi:hypothetical protein
MEPKTPLERSAHKQQLVKTILLLEYQIMNNQDSPALLASLREDYRRAHDELALYYNDDPAERVTVVK